ncbi:MAG: thiamine phosphate synthase [Candidatus Eisenbacteria bacterium]
MKFDPTLLAIVDAAHVPPDRLEEGILRAVRGGVTWIQVRAKDLATAEIIGYARAAGSAARKAGVPFLVNDRADVAILAGADGVHIGADDLPVAEARRLLGPRALIGATARDPGRARRAEADGADYLGVGPQFASPVKPELVPLPEGRSAEIGRAVSLPLVGIGGIHAGNAGRVAARGLQGMAVISALWRSPDPEEAARNLVRAFRRGETE